jgi:uncharacterized protein (UPF0264 family)
MMPRHLTESSPGLLVSVRTAAEATAALAGGADVIDVKEPMHGPLGAASFSTIADVVRAVCGRVPVTAAMGELVDLERERLTRESTSLPGGVSFHKIGLAGCRDLDNWQDHWQRALASISGIYSTKHPVAVVYADWPAARAPDPLDVLALAIEHRCPALLIDTWDKSTGDLFDDWPVEGLNAFVQRVRAHGIAVVLAGSLSEATMSEAVRLGPDLVAVRTAACDAGRNGTVSKDRVRTLKRLMASIGRTAILPPAIKLT